MKSHTKHLTMQVRERMEFINITGDVEEQLRASGIQEGLCLVNAMHITASVFINDDDLVVDWNMQFDLTSKSFYYYHKESLATRWEKPIGGQ